MDGDSLSFSIVTQPAHGTLGSIAAPDCAGNTCTADVTYTPAANYSGTDSFTFKVNDGTADSNTATVSITINPVNDAPVATTTATTATARRRSASDARRAWQRHRHRERHADRSAGEHHGHGTLTLNANGSFSYTADTGTTSDSFTYKANDGTADSDIATVTIPINAAPVAAAQSVTTNEDTAKTITSRLPTDGDAMVFSIGTSPAHGTLGGVGSPTARWGHAPPA